MGSERMLTRKIHVLAGDAQACGGLALALAPVWAVVVAAAAEKEEEKKKEEGEAETAVAAALSAAAASSAAAVEEEEEEKEATVEAGMWPCERLKVHVVYKCASPTCCAILCRADFGWVVDCARAPHLSHLFLAEYLMDA